MFFSDHDFLKLTLLVLRFCSAVRDSGNLITLFSPTISSVILFQVELRIYPHVKTPSHQSEFGGTFLKSLHADIINFATQKRKFSCQERVQLTSCLIALKQQLIQGDTSAAAEIAALECQLKALCLKDLEGVKTCSRVQWLKEGERPTNFFFRLEREHFDKNFVPSILDEDEKEVFTCVDIKCVHVNVYTKLFSSKPIDENCKLKLLDNLTVCLSEADRRIADSVASLNTGKSPAPDGLSVEFDKRFWDTLGPLLLRLVNECFEEGSLSVSIRGSATRLSCKKRGDLKNLKKWRPISLLNVDYKIISKAVTSRVSCVLAFIVNPDQTCSVPGRTNFSTLLICTISWIT